MNSPQSVSHEPVRICQLFGSEHVRILNVAEGARLYPAGSEGDCIFVVQSGIVKETMQTPEGQEIIVRLVTSGGVTGLSAMLGEPHRTAAVVMQGGVVCRISVAPVNALKAQSEALLLNLMQAWRHAMDDARVMIASFHHGSAQVRLARFLVFRQAHAEPNGFFQLRRRDATALLGVTSVSATRLIGAFKQNGWIEEQGRRCRVTNTEALSALAVSSNVVTDTADQSRRQSHPTLAA